LRFPPGDVLFLLAAYKSPTRQSLRYGDGA
jgi:hypothetical protein